MNTKHILLTSALVVSALAFTSCEDFFDTSSKKDLNTETAYSNLESAEMALVGCYDGWQRTISDEGVGMCWRSLLPNRLLQVLAFLMLKTTM